MFFPVPTIWIEKQTKTKTNPREQYMKPLWTKKEEARLLNPLRKKV